MRFKILGAIVLAVAGANIAWADQPIMNKMPRWDNGWGFQFVQEYRHESALLIGDDEVGNGLTEDVHITNFEGVYTWDRAIRLTAKLPVINDARRELLDGSGRKFSQRDSGIGDLTLALPLKNYFNLDGRSGNWSLTPQLRVPLGSRDVSKYSIADRVWGGGLSLGYETETQHYFFAAGVTGWVFEADEPGEVSAHIDLGYNINIGDKNGQILWETDFVYESDGSHTLKAGPAIYWRFTDVVHVRAEWKHDFVDYQGELDHGDGDTFKVAVGFVF